jgi:hypothetical protein
MDLALRIFLFFFTTYLLTVALHFTYFTAHEARLSRLAKESNGHEGTPLHKYLKHSHDSGDFAELSHRPVPHDAIGVPESVPAIGFAAPVSASLGGGPDRHAQLKCEGGDGTEQALVYWHQPSPADDAWESPWRPADGSRQYVTFEPDNGGWNNVRMVLQLGTRLLREQLFLEGGSYREVGEKLCL